MKLIKFISFIVILFILLSLSIYSKADTAPSVTTDAATNIFDSTARLNGNLISKGTVQLTPVVLGLAGAGAYQNNQATILLNVPVGTEFLIYQTGRTMDSCGVLSSLELNGNPGTKLAGSFKLDNQSYSAVELWYEDTPSIGTNRVLWGNWTATCGASFRHVIAAIALSGVNEVSPFSGINLQNDATTPPSPDSSLSVQLGASPSAGQIRSVIVSDVSTTSGSARMADPTGLDIQKWGWMVSGSGTTYCSASNVGCVEGGFSSGNALTADTDQPGDTFWWAYSGVLINGVEITVPSVDVYFQWGASVSLGNETMHIAKTTVGVFYLDLNGLTRGTTYYFRAIASGSSIVNGTTLSFTTTDSYAIFAGWVLIMGYIALMTMFVVSAYKFGKWRMSR